jgi:hypothetical protein
LENWEWISGPERNEKTRKLTRTGFSLDKLFERFVEVKAVNILPFWLLAFLVQYSRSCPVLEF